MFRNSLKLLASLSTLKRHQNTTIVQQFRQNKTFRIIMSEPATKSSNSDDAIKAQADRVRQLKADKADPETVRLFSGLPILFLQIAAEVQILLSLKAAAAG